MKYFNRLKNKRLLFAVLGMIVLASTVLLLFLKQDSKPQQSQPVVKVDNSANCNTDDIGTELKEKYHFFTSGQAVLLKDIVERIKSLDSGSESINCLYVLAKYAHFNGDVKQAVIYYDKILSLHSTDPNLWVSSDIGFESPEDISILREGAQKTSEAPGGWTYPDRSSDVKTEGTN